MIRTALFLPIACVFLAGTTLTLVYGQEEQDSIHYTGPEIALQAVPGSTNKFSPLNLAAFPVLGYSPETRIMGGIYSQLLAGGSDDLRPSGVGLSLLVSQNRQFSINLLPDLWWRENSFHLAGELKWQHWPDRFYGIGNNTRTEDKEYYVSRIAGIKLDMMISTWDRLLSGMLLEFESNNIVEYDSVSHAVLPGGSIPGSSHSLISGIGFGAAWDSRSDILLPDNGCYLQFRAVYFNKAMGSTHRYTKWIVDLRNYMELGRGHLLYLQAYFKFHVGPEIPFRNMALLGGDRFLRGYFKGRYRDNNMFLTQAEYHSPTLWRFSLVVFAGAGDVFHSSLSEVRIKPSAGIGLRYKVFRDRRMNIRLDLAAGRGDNGIYLGILEAF
jgi:hypothetical protein